MSRRSRSQDDPDTRNALPVPAVGSQISAPFPGSAKTIEVPVVVLASPQSETTFLPVTRLPSEADATAVQKFEPGLFRREFLGFRSARAVDRRRPRLCWPVCCWSCLACDLDHRGPEAREATFGA